MRGPGTVRAALRGAFPEEAISALAAAGLRLRDPDWQDELTVRFALPARDLRRAEEVAKKYMCTLTVTEDRRPGTALRRMGIRALYPLLLLGMAAAVFFLQNRLLFFSVEGSETLPAERILWALEEAGVGVGTPAGDIDPELLENRLRLALPELGYLGINTEGPFATVTVRERRRAPEGQVSRSPAHIVARRDALVLSLDALRGEPKVAPGDTVTAGEVLISGDMDLERVQVRTRAAGEILGETFYEKQALDPGNRQKKCPTGRTTTKYSVRIGKKTINFFKTSGISYGDYDTILYHATLKLPGDLALPVELTCRVFRELTLAPGRTGDEAAAEQALETQLLRGMRAGEILSRSFREETAGAGRVLTGRFRCREEIGSLAEIED